MPDVFLQLPDDGRLEILEAAERQTLRAAHLLEKDVWVVWTLQALFSSPFADGLAFKGGTSLSKAYAAIERFSEDVDLTYDIRKLVPDEENAGNPPDLSRSQANRLSKRIRDHLLPHLLATEVAPYLIQCLNTDKLSATVSQEGSDLFIAYDPVTAPPAYLKSRVKLEFGARATGEPSEARLVTCYAAEVFPDLMFPSASPRVMRAERTFWEKATAMHVFSRQGRFRGDGVGFARHWHDLVRLDDIGVAAESIADRGLAVMVADHKSKFFPEKDADGIEIDYHAAISGELQLVAEGDAYDVLAADYAQMVDAGLLTGEIESFEALMARCLDLQTRINAAAQLHASPA